MKKSVLLLMVASLFAAMPVLAAQHEKEMSVNAYLEHCAQQSETIDQKIKRLQSEIKTGKKTYSAEELQKLEMKLKEANYMLDALSGP